MQLEAVFDQSVFDETLKEYMRYSKRTLPVIINTKACWIARKANWFTHAADEVAVKSGLARVQAVTRINKAGKTVTRMVATNVLTPGRSGAPLAALIIHKRLREAGKDSPFKGVSRRRGAAEMLLLVRKLINARARSVRFLKSGFNPAIRILEPLSDNSKSPPIDRKAKQYGQAKGDATPAHEDWNCIATMINNATGRRDSGSVALATWGARGLQQAFDDEVRSMREYIATKLAPGADKFNRDQMRRRMIVAT